MRRNLFLAASSVAAGAVLALALLSTSRGDEIPPELERELARTSRGHEVLRRFADDAGHDPLPPARAGDWRSGPGRGEEPQEFRHYVASDPVRATETRRRIVLAPVGPFDERGREVLARMREYAEIFFACPVELGDALGLPETNRRTRQGPAGEWVQYLSTEILYDVLEPRLPDDAIAYLGITMGDLYPDPSWNFVFGQAALQRRVGVYSLARYSGAFYGEKETDRSAVRFLERACKVLSHETGHMFGLEHCLHYLCVMNGSNGMAETDRAPAWLCPVCLSKLLWNRGFDPADRHRKLAAFFEEIGLPETAAWHRARAE